MVSATEQPDKYLFFIDDANELADLSLILAYTTKGYLGYKVKIIVTVRDYARAKVLSVVKEYTIPPIIEIHSFTDDEIKGFLDNNMEIRNEDYVKQIIRIAEGNPRMAYMAGKLAKEKQNLTAIKDASQLYDAYYEKYVNGTIGSDNDLCFTAGILSVINTVLLNNMSALQELLDNYGISVEDFKKKILYLSKLEVVEIQLDQVATLSDQCLANYMLYYVFFETKLFPLSGIIETGYKYFRNGVVIPRFLFVPPIIEKRKPLRENARRAGWFGCNILIQDIPVQGKIDIIRNQIISNVDDVVQMYKHIEKLQTNRMESRGWLFDVLNCINQIPSVEFTLGEIYAYAEDLQQKHIENHNIEAKIRQQLQILRDKGFIEFVGRGKYRKITL